MTDQHPGTSDDMSRGGDQTDDDTARTEHSGAGVEVAADHDAAVDTLPGRFENPGLPAHRARGADSDPKAARNAERQVAALFGLSMVGTVVFVVAYFAIPIGDGDAEQLMWSNRFLGLGLAFALLGIGVGAVHWAKTLMPDTEVVEERHAYRSSDEDREAAVDILKTGSAESGIGRRPLIRNTLLGAVGLTGVPAVLALRDLGPLPGDDFSTTLWEEGTPLVIDKIYRKIRPEDISIGSVVHVMPETIQESEHVLDDAAKAAVLVMRLPVDELIEDPDKADWSYDGIVAYSKICTHVGCPVALYERTTHHLLCPCHQSTFDVTQHCKVIFGPAKRPLPQLPITVDDEGYLVARSGFTESVGPSFWERG